MSKLGLMHRASPELVNLNSMLSLFSFFFFIYNTSSALPASVFLAEETCIDLVSVPTMPVLHFVVAHSLPGFSDYPSLTGPQWLNF